MEASDIIAAVDIVDYISQFVDLTQKGREYWGLSCFTDEKTPSFSVDPGKQVFADFSSGASGNLASFVMKYYNCSFPKALDILKKYAGITEETESSKTLRLEATKVAKRYRDHLRKPPKMTAKPMPKNCMEQYEFRKDKLQVWADEGITWKTMREFGVKYDAFNDRIVYPVKDYDWNIVSICGRTCDPDYKEKRIPKYIYQTPIGTLDTLYGYSDNRQDILDTHEIIIFEGAKSCMKAREWGFRNTAALLTSHLSTHQLRFLIKLCSFNSIVVVFALDSDIDISKDDNIRKLCGYARVQWVKNRDNLLPPKDSPTDQGREVFEDLYTRRERCDFVRSR
jgi:DNA primase